MNDVIVQFARLWGQRETLAVPFTEEEERVSEQLRSYDSDDCLKVLSAWAEEFLSNNNAVEDELIRDFNAVEFFEKKLKEIV